MRHVPLVLVLLLAVAWLPAASANKPNASDLPQNVIASEEERANDDLKERREKAADFRVKRQTLINTLTEDDHVAGFSELVRIRRLLAQDEVGKAGEASRVALKRHGYTRAGGALQHMLIRCYALSKNLGQTRIALVDLYERYPEYESINQAREEALVVAEAVQATHRVFNFEADSPREVISSAEAGDLESANLLFRFLAQHGGPLAPRGALGLARSHLIRAHQNMNIFGNWIKDLILARESYEDFLDHYGDHEMVFDALCEYAISQLLAYRGDHYDLAVLVAADAIINEQAQVYAKEDPERLKIIAKYRSLIRRWRQDRDLQVGRWYDQRDRPEASRLYYRAVIAADRTSLPGVEAERRSADLPKQEPGPLTGRP